MWLVSNWFSSLQFLSFPKSRMAGGVTGFFFPATSSKKLANDAIPSRYKAFSHIVCFIELLYHLLFELLLLLLAWLHKYVSRSPRWPLRIYWRSLFRSDKPLSERVLTLLISLQSLAATVFSLLLSPAWVLLVASTITAPLLASSSLLLLSLTLLCLLLLRKSRLPLAQRNSEVSR